MGGQLAGPIPGQPQRPQDEMSERYRAQQVSGVFGGGDILQQIIAALTGGAGLGGPAAPGAANVPGSIIGPGAGGIQLAAPAPSPAVAPVGPFAPAPNAASPVVAPAVPGAAPVAAPPGEINIDPVVAAIIQAYQQMIAPQGAAGAGNAAGGAFGGLQGMPERPAPGPISLGTVAGPGDSLTGPPEKPSETPPSTVWA